MKKYYNKELDKYYYEGQPLTHRISKSSFYKGVPNEKKLTELGYVEVTEEPIVIPEVTIDPERLYKDKVIEKIRLRYSIDDEFAILRQKDEKPLEYSQYYSYCESCKSEAKAELGIEEGGE